MLCKSLDKENKAVHNEFIQLWSNQSCLELNLCRRISTRQILCLYPTLPSNWHLIYSSLADSGLSVNQCKSAHLAAKDGELHDL